MPEQPEVPCPSAVFQQAHGAHDWDPVGLGPVHCPGVTSGQVKSPDHHFRGASKAMTPEALPALQVLRARLVIERDAAKARASKCTIPGSRQAAVGNAAGISAALYLIDETIRSCGGADDTTPAEEGVAEPPLTTVTHRSQP